MTNAPRESAYCNGKPEAWRLTSAAAGAGSGQRGKRHREQSYEQAAKAQFRAQALDWLKAERAWHRQQLESDKPADHVAIQETLLAWQTAGDLAGIRDAAALARLPAEEQKAFAQLWADVAALLKKAEEKSKVRP